MFNRVVRFLVYVAVFVVVVSGGALRAQVDGSPSADIPRFEGYLTLDGAPLFALTARRAGAVAGHALLQIGESFCGFRLERFNRATEVLTLTDALGKKHELKLPNPTFLETGPSDAAKRIAAKAKALQQIEDYRKSVMRRFGLANVTVDLDGSLIPDSRKKNYESHRVQAEQKGMLFFPVCVNGKWHNTFVPIEGKNPDPKSLLDLTPEDIDEIRLLWKVAQAELGGRVLAGPPIQSRKTGSGR
ncbi:MAG: hypothetical protein HY735_18315 [Verrucomicrobia bacterium]|nr:hypothetical protein [Verrucomicrobiota bacterium]